MCVNLVVENFIDFYSPILKLCFFSLLLLRLKCCPNSTLTFFFSICNCKLAQNPTLQSEHQAVPVSLGLFLHQLVMARVRAGV